MAADIGDDVVSSGDGAVTELHSNKKEEMKEVEEEEEQQQQQLLPYLDEGIVTNILVRVHSAESLFKSLRACANGLMLVSPSSNLTTLCVVNPLTNHRLVLPPVPVDAFPALASVKFIFLPRTRNYKVLVPAEKIDNIVEEETSYVVYVLTLSSSGDFCQLSSSNDDDDDPSRLWRVFKVPLPANSAMGIPLAIDGVMYWSTYCHGEEGYYIISFDVTSEIFYTTPHNIFDGVEYAYNQGIMDMGGYIAVWFVLHDEPTEGDYTIDVHVTKDLHRPAGGAKWKEVYRGVAIDPGFVKAYKNAAPSFGNGEVIIFRNTEGGPLVVYNFKSQQWWQVVGNNLTLPDDLVCFYGYHVENMPVPSLEKLSPPNPGFLD